jgi:hypothetical protein
MNEWSRIMCGLGAMVLAACSNQAATNDYAGASLVLWLFGVALVLSAGLSKPS